MPIFQKNETHTYLPEKLAWLEKKGFQALVDSTCFTYLQELRQLYEKDPMSTESRQGVPKASGVDAEMHFNVSQLLASSVSDPTTYKGFLHVPQSESYLPLIIPQDVDWLDKVRRLFEISAQAFIADIWTQLLLDKQDYKERPLYLMWDEQVPKPNHLTSLFWLLHCESWPMPTHNKVASGWSKLSHIFPAQPILFPASTPYGYASNRPSFDSDGFTKQTTQALARTLSISMTRSDRDKMAKTEERAIIYRPQKEERITTYAQHCGQRISPLIWSKNEGWVYQPIGNYDAGVSRVELQESTMHIQRLSDLRDRIQDYMFSTGGIPTHPNTINDFAGMSTRYMSESNIRISPDNLDLIYWSENKDKVSLDSGRVLSIIPFSAPLIWFNWTHIGPKYEQKGSEMVRVESASEAWVKAYFAHREHALQMLFQPDSVDVATLINAATRERGNRLARTGRLNGAKLRTVSDHTDSKIFNAFQQLLNKNHNDQKD